MGGYRLEEEDLEEAVKVAVGEEEEDDASQAKEDTEEEEEAQ